MQPNSMISCLVSGVYNVDWRKLRLHFAKGCKMKEKDAGIIRNWTLAKCFFCLLSCLVIVISYKLLFYAVISAWIGRMTWDEPNLWGASPPPVINPPGLTQDCGTSWRLCLSWWPGRSTCDTKTKIQHLFSVSKCFTQVSNLSEGKFRNQSNFKTQHPRSDKAESKRGDHTFKVFIDGTKSPSFMHAPSSHFVFICF